MGEDFAEGLPSNTPLGHYFDALFLTGYCLETFDQAENIHKP